MIEKVFGLFNDRNPSVKVVLYCLDLLLLLIAAGIFFGLWKLLARSWTRIAGGFAAFALLFVYLAHDESTYRHPMTMEDISPVFPGEDASYNLLMRYGKQHPLGQSFQAPTFKNPYPKLAFGDICRIKGGDSHLYIRNLYGTLGTAIGTRALEAKNKGSPLVGAACCRDADNHGTFQALDLMPTNRIPSYNSRSC